MLSAVSLAMRVLWCRKSGSNQYRSEGLGLFQLTVGDLLRDTEIGDLDSTLVVHQDVGTLDIAMNDVSSMQVI
jgi:hypothetical protein